MPMLLEVKNLNKTYHTGKVDFKALLNVSVDIERGEFTAIVGPSGSGKTTLLNCIGSIDRGEEGRIFFDGEDIMEKDKNELAHFRRENFGFIFQTYNLIPVLTVFENIEMPLKLLKRHSDAEIRESVLGILERLDMKGLENRRPLELSGGQQQRVSIARALIKKPKLILADEPTANLDSVTGESIINIMKELNEKEGITFIFSTHDSLVMKYAGRMIEIRDGMIK